MSAPRPSGDEASVSVLVRVPVEDAFRIFTEEIDQWWRTGVRYRIGGERRSVVHLEGKAAEQMLRLMNALEESDDVQNVWANFDISDEAMEAFGG